MFLHQIQIEDSRAGERLRLILVLKETKCWVWTSWKFNNHSDWRVLLWEWCVFHGSLRCSMIASKGREGLRNLMMAAPHCVSLTKVHVSHGEFSKVNFCKKFSFFVGSKTSSCVSKSKSWTLWPKSLGEIHKRTTNWNVTKNKKKE